MTLDAASTLTFAIDQGTTSTTTILVDGRGSVIAQECIEFSPSYPRPGWVECDPEGLWTVTQQVMRRTLRQTPAGARVVAIGITNQRETVIVWDRQTGKPIYPAIVWQCRRTADMCVTLKQSGIEELVRKKTGLLLDPYFSATKIAWILDRVEGARKRAERGELAFGTVDTWLLWKLTAGDVHKTDYTNASRTLLFDIEKLAWDSVLLHTFRVPAGILPAVCPSANVFGTVKGGELDGIPIAGIAGDQQAALFGQLCLQPGKVKNTYGTGCFLVLNTGARRVYSQTGLLTTLACSLTPAEPVYALEGSVFVAGAAVQWLRDGLGIIDTASETADISRSVADTAGVVVVPAFTGLGAPYWDTEARGAILGLTLGTKREHIVRATLEAIALQGADIAAAMATDAGTTLKRLCVDGGAAANDFLLQFQADILGIKVERPRYTETTGLGAAYLAGLTAGVWQDVAELETHRTVDRLFSPQIDASQRRQKLAEWKTAVQRVQKI